MADIQFRQAQPVQARKGISTSVTAWLVLVAYWVLAILISFFEPGP